MRRDELGCDARRGDEVLLAASRGAATPQRAHSAAACGCGRALAPEGAKRQLPFRGVMALRVAAKCGARFGAALGKGVTIAGGPLRAIILIWLQRIPLSLLK